LSWITSPWKWLSPDQIHNCVVSASTWVYSWTAAWAMHCVH
jgi:hypothetical protein